MFHNVSFLYYKYKALSRNLKPLFIFFKNRVRNSLQEVQKSCNHAGQRCQEMQSRIESSVSAVKAAEEYVRFTDQNKTPPPSPVVFKFDASLLKGFETLQLNPRAVTLDDLTIDTLKAKLQENDVKLGECRSKIKEKQTLIIQYETELQTVKFKSDPASVARMFTVKKTMDFLKKEANELQCVEQKLTRQNEMIQTPIADLGCEQVKTILQHSQIVCHVFNKRWLIVYL